MSIKNSFTSRQKDLSPAKQALLEQRLNGRSLQPIPAAFPKSRPANEPAPLSFAQERLWFLEQLEPNRAIYNIPVTARATGPLNIPALEASLQAIIARHATLRTRFELVNDQPVQIIEPTAVFRLDYTDLRHLPPAQREQEAHRLARIEAERPFDLTRPPLLRASLIHLTEQEYFFLLTIHHIAADGWSIGVFYRELTELYTQNQTFIEPPSSPFAPHSSLFAPLPIQYADYAYQQREWLQSSEFVHQMAYWRKQLANAPALLELPTDRPRPAVQSYRGAMRHQVLSPALTTSLKTLSRQENVTLFMTLLAAFNTLLYRYTGQTDLLVGTPVANRPHTHLEPLIGFFVNTLVMRTDLSGDPTFHSLLERVRQVSLEAYNHQEIPFEKLVMELEPIRSLAHSPLFQVMFALQNAAPTRLQLPEITFSHVDVDTRTAKFDLMLNITDSPKGLIVELEYNSDLFGIERVERMLGHYEQLLTGIVANPHQPINQLTWLTEAEMAQLSAWNHTSQVFAPSLAHDWVAQQANRIPSATAVSSPTASLTYAQLNAQANQLAHFLLAQGVQPNTPVAICLERSVEMAVAVLAVLKAGAPYLPLDPAYPPDRLTFMLADSGTAVLLTSPHLPLTIDHSPLTIYSLDTLWPQLDTYPTTNPTTAVSPHHLAYLIYTSGSTGQPKGVAMPHAALANLLAWQQAALPQPARTLQFAPLSFDVSFQELFCTWSSGGSLFLISEELRRDALALLRFIQQHQIERLFLPYIALQHLANTAVSHSLFPTCLQDVITAGEQLHITPAITTFFRHLPTCRLHNQYGPSETHVVTAYTLPNDPTTWPPFPPIGRPLPNCTIHLLDAHGQPVPIGIPGELYIGGSQLAHGYLNRPDLTDLRFAACPEFIEGIGDLRFRGQPLSANRLYRTGDLACYQPDGHILYLGRTDDQVKIRGFRIEPAEVEQVLNQHSAVYEAAVIAQPGVDGLKQLVAYVTPADAPLSQLRAYLQEKLPAYMMPAVFVPLDSLPLTPSGKLNRRALPPPDTARQVTSANFLRPRTPVEETVVEIWADLLGLRRENVGINDNFFEIGGHSLLATQVISRIRTLFQMELPLRVLFESPTVASLAERMATWQLDHSPLPTIQVISRQNPLPLSFAQQRLWLLAQLEPDSAVYNLPEAIRLQGVLDVAALEYSLSAIITRHETWRTTFARVGEQPAQIIHAPTAFHFSACAETDWCTVEHPLLDLRPFPPYHRETHATLLLNQITARPFDLEHGPLVRVALLQLDQTDHILLIVAHHIITDGWSRHIFHQELATLYSVSTQYSIDGKRDQTDSLLALPSSLLPPLPIQYADYAGWQRNWLQGQVLESQLAYWRQQLADMPPVLELPTDQIRPITQTSHGAAEFRLFPRSLADSLKSLSHQHGVTLYMTLLAAFQVLLHRYTGQTDLPIGTPIANRNRREIEGLMGFFVNTLVLRTRLDGSPSFLELLGRVREVALGAFAHQDMPFEYLVEMLQPTRSASHAPLFQVMFALQNTPQEKLHLPGLTLNWLDVGSDTTPFDLSLSMMDREDGLTAALVYNRDLFEAATITRLLDHFQVLLQGIITQPNQPISTLPLLTPTEQQQILYEWNPTPEPVLPLLVHQLFEAQVERTPDATAVFCGIHRLTYRQLNEQANQLAHHLQNLGVGEGMLVGVLMERSPDVVIALLGIWKAGAAYLPLDPTYPDERLAYMLQDSGTAILITHKEIYDLRSTIDDSGSPIVNRQPKTVNLTADWPTIATSSTHNPTLLVSTNGLAYVIYTSGSTGQPKGVLVEQGAFTSHCQHIARYYNLSDQDTVLQFASFSFDTSLEQLATALISGASLVIREDEVWSPPQLQQHIARHGISVMNLPTAYWHQVLAAWEHTDTAETRQTRNTLRLVMVGGEAMSPQSLKLWQKVKTEGERLLNVYGPTEAVVTVAGFEMTPAYLKQLEAKTGTAVPIGRPIGERQLYILDPAGQPAPIGIPGELYIGGTLARGYLNRPDLTTEKFTIDDSPNRKSTILNRKLYRSGDLARYLPDGTIEFLGRADDQVKIRGYRVELGEIEAALREHTAVQEAVVLAHSHETTGTRLVAYLVMSQAIENDALLRSYLKQRLPAHMIPTSFIYLDALPLTPNGKINHKALPVPTIAPQERPFIAPNSPLEHVLVLLWGDLLDVEPVGIEDDFFALGGHSLLATQLMGRIFDLFQQEVPLRHFFTTPTIAGLTASLLQDSTQHHAVQRTAELLLQIAELPES